MVRVSAALWGYSLVKEHHLAHTQRVDIRVKYMLWPEGVKEQFGSGLGKCRMAKPEKDASMPIGRGGSLLAMQERGRRPSP